MFIHKHPCRNATIGVISLNNSSSQFRTNFTKGKLEKYGCTAGHHLHSFTEEDAQYEEDYDEEGLNNLIKQVTQN